MDIQATYQDHLRRFRPAYFRHLQQTGTLEQVTQQAEKEYREATARYQANGLSRVEANSRALDDLLPSSEREDQSQAARMDEAEQAEMEQFGQMAEDRAAGYDPHKKGKQSWTLPDGRQVFKDSRGTRVYPPETSASTQRPSDKVVQE